MSVQTALTAIATGNTALHALLYGTLTTEPTSGVGVRFHPDDLPQKVIYPAIRFQETGTRSHYTFGTVKVISVTVLMVGYAMSDAAREALTLAMRGAFLVYRPVSAGGETVQGVVIDNQFTDSEMLNTNVKAYRRIMYLIVHLQQA